VLTREMGAKVDRLVGSIELPDARALELESSSHTFKADCADAAVEFEV
jgi:hypothetical protein